MDYGVSLMEGTARTKGGQGTGPRTAFVDDLHPESGPLFLHNQDFRDDRAKISNIKPLFKLSNTPTTKRSH